ncbi:MAG: hypothetical protein ACLSIF_05835 [Faecalimonas umbilicata]
MADLHISDRENAYASFEEIGTVSFENEKMYDASDGDMGMYLLGLFRFWNMYEYYSPNIEITTEEWDSVAIWLRFSAKVMADYRVISVELRDCNRAGRFLNIGDALAQYARGSGAVIILS